MTMYTHLAIIDFEANCLNNKLIEPQEIIEFPVIVYDLINHCIDYKNTFHYYCQAMLPITKYCTELTGITQEQVDSGLPFVDVIRKLNKWVFENGWINSDGTYSVLFVTHGDWDLQTALPKQCKYSHIRIPGYLKKWCNVKIVFKEIYGKKGRDMVSIMKEMNLPLIGRHHSGIDDAKNIARIVKKLHHMGAIFSETGWLVE